jgi:hypothetical protein
MFVNQEKTALNSFIPASSIRIDDDQILRGSPRKARATRSSSSRWPKDRERRVKKMPLQVDGTGGITKEGIPFFEDLLSAGKDDLLLLTAPYSSYLNSKNKMYRQFCEKEGLLFSNF